MIDTLKEQLLEDGYCVAKGILGNELIAHLVASSKTALSIVSEEHRRLNKSQGSLLNLSEYPDFAELIGSDALLRLFEQLHFQNTIFSSGYIISKPAKSPALFWHQDWWGWDDPLSYRSEIAQVFLMIYLTPTTVHNGCLRVLPGSHRKQHSLHAATAAHGETLSRVDNPDDPLYKAVPGEVPVMVQPGDVVVGDARLLHSTYPNESDNERTLLTLWYHPNFPNLPSGMKARIQEIFYRRGVDTDPGAASLKVMSDWPEDALDLIKHLLPDYQGKALPHAWNREPDPGKLL